MVDVLNGDNFAVGRGRRESKGGRSRESGDPALSSRYDFRTPQLCQSNDHVQPVSARRLYLRSLAHGLDSFYSRVIGLEGDRMAKL